jgi:hypothetical protein
MVQAARPDPVGAAFILLHLLEGKPKSLSKFFLAHPQHRPALSHPAPDVDIDRLGSATGADRFRALLWCLVGIIHVLDRLPISVNKTILENSPKFVAGKDSYRVPH